MSSPPTFTNYVAYQSPNALSQPRIGHLNFETSTIQPLSFASGTALSDLYQVIEIGESQIKPAGESIPLSSVKILPPISGRDILAVGKNYFEHAIEFNSSGYDSSDKADQPTHPVIFTKRATSIIGHGDTIYRHPDFTQTLDYEGEIGVIIGKNGFRISEANAMDHVWGYTIINDVTARERQRDHKQFYIGKSGDTFCPMGPIAVPAKHLPKSLRIQTYVNGQKRQDSTTAGLIFSVPVLVQTLSEGTTLQAGDVIATGTPAGVGFGQKPPVFLKPGDVIEVTVTGLGKLVNTVGDGSENATEARINVSHIPISNSHRAPGRVGSTNSKQIVNFPLTEREPPSPSIIFIHGLGATSESFYSLVISLNIRDTHAIYSLDLEGQGLSPTSAASTVSIASYASDVYALAKSASITQATIVAHDMGCLVALLLAIECPEIVSKLVLLGPNRSPSLHSDRSLLFAAATKARSFGMMSIVDTMGGNSVSMRTRRENLLALTAVRLSLLSQDPEGYAKACTALANHTEPLQIQQIKAKTLIITGDEDIVSPPDLCEEYVAKIPGSTVAILPETGHWHIFENLKGVADAVRPFLSE